MASIKHQFRSLFSFQTPELNYNLMILRALLVLLLFSCGQILNAASVLVCTTGVSSSGSQLPVGAIDPHWQIVSGPGVSAPIPAVVLSDQRIGSVNSYMQTPDSRWIWVNDSGVALFDAPYVFQLVFDLTGIDPARVSLSGIWGVDNVGFIRLNGSTNGIGSGIIALPDVLYSNYEVLHSFTLNNGFLPGTNLLEFVVTDTGVIGALNVSDLRITVDVPEPGSIFLQALVAASMTAAITRRNRRIAKFK